MSFRWEEELRKSFLGHADPSIWSTVGEVRRVRTVMESTCSDGRADWVWAHITCSWPAGIPVRAATLLQQPTCSRVLSSLKRGAARCEDYLFPEPESRSARFDATSSTCLTQSSSGTLVTADTSLGLRFNGQISRSVRLSSSLRTGVGRCAKPNTIGRSPTGYSLSCQAQPLGARQRKLRRSAGSTSACSVMIPTA